MKGFLEDEYHRECDYHDAIDSQRIVLVHVLMTSISLHLAV